MTAKEFLSQAWHIDARIEDKLAEIDRIEEKRERIMAKLTAGRMTRLTGMPRGGNYDWTDSLEQVIQTDELIRDAKQALLQEVAELCRIKREVNDAINAVEDLRYRQVLELRYRSYMDWTSIAERMHYEVRHVTRLHGEALLCVRVPEAKEAEYKEAMAHIMGPKIGIFPRNLFRKALCWQECP